MKKYLLPALFVLALITPAFAALPSNSNINAALKEALTLGTQRVVASLGKQDGFNLDPKIHIPLPTPLQKVDRALTMVGMGAMTDDLELRINRAAESSMPQAKTIFINAIKKMTITDAQAILTGPDDAATQYLKKAMTPDLTAAMVPVVQKALSNAGAIKSYDQVMGKYNQLPLVSGVKSNLTNYAVDKTIAGMFYYVAKEEAAIRTNPAQQASNLLKTVFSAVR